MYTCTHVVDTHLHIYNTCIHTYLHTYVHILHKHFHTYKYTYIQTCIFNYVHAYLHTNIHTVTILVFRILYYVRSLFARILVVFGLNFICDVSDSVHAVTWLVYTTRCLHSMYHVVQYKKRQDIGNDIIADSYNNGI